MQFLIDANLPRSTAARVRARGHEAIDAREADLGAADDTLIAAYAQCHQLALITRDFDFADVRNYPPRDYAGLVVVDLPSEATPGLILDVLEDFLNDQEVLARLRGNLAIVELAIVECGRVRLRSG